MKGLTCEECGIWIPERMAECPACKLDLGNEILAFYSECKYTHDPRSEICQMCITEIFSDGKKP